MAESIAPMQRTTKPPISSHNTESAEHALSRVQHLMERQRNSLTLDNPRFVERYLNSELWINVHFRIGNSAEYAACLQYFQGSPRSNVAHHVVRKRESLSRVFPGPVLSKFLRRSECFRIERIPRRYSKQQAVFVDIVKLAQSPRPVVSSFVWFDAIEEFYKMFPSTLNYLSSRRSVVTFGGITDWEFGSPCNGPASTGYDPTSQIVKSTTHIIDGVTSNERDISLEEY